MYQILVVGALSQELNIIRKKIKESNVTGLKIDFLQTGMGNYNTIFALTQKLNKKDYDFILNIGISGIRVFENKEKKTINSFYQVSNIMELDTGKELIVPIFLNFGKLLTCLSANKPIRNLSKGIENNFSKILLDMESYGFEFVLEKYNKPRILLKVPIDSSDKELENFDYKKALDILGESIDYNKLLLDIKKYLDTTKKDNLKLDKYFSQLNFSQRQKEIFEFLYRKYNIVVGEDFDKFFYNFLKENKNNKNKKQLVSKLFKDIECLFS